MGGQNQTSRQDSALTIIGPMRAPQCNKCGKYHKGSAGHALNQFAILGYVFAMSKEEAEASLELIRGTISLCDTEIFALFDSGATHSFISNECVENLKLLVIELLVLMNVSIPAGASMKTSRACLKFKMRFGNRITLIDLVCLPKSGIDVIVGMDWLSANGAILDCEKKTVSLPVFKVPEDIISVVNLEIPIYLFAMQIKTLDHERCTLDEIGVANAFPEVFTDEMSGLPLEREIEFYINLVLRTKPIFKAPYCIVPSELEELKK
ncbi:uncharacterized protein LOC129302769 [Prosopis cineraria]|uniref:uncharacterized protein LOC129302769 n=1 Tax=Prosopis cineraria TaxID=364024 RepID=UPI00240F3A3C|nr:uncharacterized protein LOC129302769 [Prosopis cineraria]